MKKNKKKKKTKKEENKKISSLETSNLNINWYPGHMYKTKEELKELIKKVDLVLEIRDARIPFSSSNEDLKEIIKNKEKIIILNKADLADDKITEEWVQYLEKTEKSKTLAVNSMEQKDISKIKNEIKNLNIVKEKKQIQNEKGIVNPKINIIIVGIPNSGKSTIINKLVGKNSQNVQNIPGVTKKNKWIRTKENINILDTPGVLIPKLDEKTGIKLAIIGSIKASLFDAIEIASYLLKNIIHMGYIKELSDRYKIDIEYIENIKKYEEKILKEKEKYLQEKCEEEFYNNLENLYFEYNIKIYELMKEIGEKRGFLKKGNDIDDEKTSNILLNEFQKGLIGKISLERSQDE